MARTAARAEAYRFQQFDSALRAGGRSTTNHNSDSSARQQGGELGGNA